MSSHLSQDDRRDKLTDDEPARQVGEKTVSWGDFTGPTGMVSQGVCVDQEPSQLVWRMFPDVDGKSGLDATNADPGKQLGDQPMPIGCGDGFHGYTDHEDDPDGVHCCLSAESVGEKRQKDLTNELASGLNAWPSHLDG